MNDNKLARPIQRIVRFNEAENEYINDKLERSPFRNFQNFARILLISGEVKMVDYSELENLNGEVRRIGNNINQIAKLANQFEEISSDDIQDLLLELNHLSDLIQQTLEKEYRIERTI